MVKTARIASAAALIGLVVGVCLVGAAPVARALSNSDKPASIVVWPKIVVDTTGRFTSGAPTDTVVQLSNTDSVNQKQAHCFYIDANSHCADTQAVCETAINCPSGGGFAACVPGWQEIDFDIIMTPDQPLAWHASRGLRRGDFPLEGPGTCTTPPGRSCTRNTDCGFPNGTCQLGFTNLGSGIPPAPEDPFFGSLTCIQFDPSQNPAVPDHTSSRNKLKGEAAIEVVPSNTLAAVDVQKYNAIGLLATANATGAANELQIGNGADGSAATKEYEACPQTLILDHLFDGATDPVASAPGAVTGTVRTDLTLVPCGNNFLTQTPGRVTAQFVVFNEFEQRFSASRTVDCFLETDLSLLDTRNSGRSIFNAGVSGTIAGQTRIRGVSDAATGRGLLGVARIFVNNTVTSTASGAAYNLHQQGDPPTGTQPDIITIP